MQTQQTTQGLVRRTMNELVMAEMFLVQATIESATVIGEGINELGKQIASADDAGPAKWEAITGTLHRIADAAVEPYTSRFRYLRDMRSVEH